MAEGSREELVETGFGAPIDKALLLEEELPFGQLALNDAGSGLNFTQFEVVDELWEELVKI